MESQKLQNKATGLEDQNANHYNAQTHAGK